MLVTVGNPPAMGPCASEPPAGLRARVSGREVTLLWNAPQGGVQSFLLEAGYVSRAVDAPAPTDIGPTPSVVAPNVASGRYLVRMRAECLWRHRRKRSTNRVLSDA